MRRWDICSVHKNGDNVIDLLLRNRGFDSSIRNDFLETLPFTDYIKDLPADFKRSIILAKEKILQAIESGIPIIIHGDYDADGICAAAILYKTLTSTLGYEKVITFLPNRFDHGYGLSIESVEEVGKMLNDRYKSGKGLLITVDCGITAGKDVIKKAVSLGMDIVITDHHQKGNNVPDVSVLVWTDLLVGSSISLILSLALGLKDRKVISLAGIATVTDLIPLKGFNRALVRDTLEILNSNPPQSIKALLKVASRDSGVLSTYDIGYVIGPRINASGRMESAYDSLQLLTQEDETRLNELALKLDKVNSERQAMTVKLVEHANALVADNLTSQNLLVCESSDFHEGVIGLVAGKLAQMHYKPVVVVSSKTKGSARSVNGVNIVELLRKLDSYFENVGGHPMAAGFTLKEGVFSNFKEDLLALALQEVDSELLVPSIRIDLEIPISYMNEDLVSEIEKLKPFGVGNPEPVFLSRNLSVIGLDCVGKFGNHLTLKLFDGVSKYKAIVFDANESGINTPVLGNRVDIVYTASIKEYNKLNYVNYIVKDLKIF